MFSPHTSDTPFTCGVCSFRLFLPVAALDHCVVGLYDDARFPGRCLVVLREHHEDLAVMPVGTVNAFFADVLWAGRAIRRVTGADRINYAVLGNAEPHVHAHVIPRIFKGDPIPTKAPWQHPWAAYPLDSFDRERLVEQLNAALNAERSR